MEYDYIIVGCGFFGSVMAERIATLLNKKILIIDKRNHLGGNCYSEIDKKTGIEFHTYGTHIFHTSSEKVYEYISNFTQFNNYHHRVYSQYKNEIFPLPINLKTINQFFGKEFNSNEAIDFINEKKIECLKPKNLEEKIKAEIGEELYKAFIYGYTKKQWNRDPKKLPASIIKRLPIYFDDRQDYFHNCRWQGIPLDGYTKIFEKMLNHRNIEVRLNTDYFEIKNDIKVKEKTVYTGPIDKYFNYQFGRLDHRSIELKKEIKDVENFQNFPVVNFADEKIEYTRIHEPKHLHPERNLNSNQSILFYEYSKEDLENPFYPIRDKKNVNKLNKYNELAEKEKNVIFGGRLGTFSYYDMDQVIAQALTCFSNLTR